LFLSIPANKQAVKLKGWTDLNDYSAGIKCY